MVSSVNIAQQYSVNPLQQRTENNGQVRRDRDDDDNGTKQMGANARTGSGDSVSGSSNLQVAASQNSGRSGQNGSSSFRGTLFDATV